MQPLDAPAVESDEAAAAAKLAAVMLVEDEPEEDKPKTYVRAGFTTNKGHGQSKARRKMAAESRRRNRR